MPSTFRIKLHRKPETLHRERVQECNGDDVRALRNSLHNSWTMFHLMHDHPRSSICADGNWKASRFIGRISVFSEDAPIGSRWTVQIWPYEGKLNYVLISRSAWMQVLLRWKKIVNRDPNKFEWNTSCSFRTCHLLYAGKVLSEVFKRRQIKRSELKLFFIGNITIWFKIYFDYV